MKAEIKQILSQDTKLLSLLDNPSASTDKPDAYWGQNLFPYFKEPAADDTASNTISVLIQDTRPEETGRLKKKQTIQFYIACREATVLTDEGPRHDLLACLIRDHFQWRDFHGAQLILSKNKEGRSPGGLLFRKLSFSTIRPNSLTKGTSFHGTHKTN